MNNITSLEHNGMRFSSLYDLVVSVIHTYSSPVCPPSFSRLLDLRLFYRRRASSICNILALASIEQINREMDEWEAAGLFDGRALKALLGVAQQAEARWRSDTLAGTHEYKERERTRPTLGPEPPLCVICLLPLVSRCVPHSELLFPFPCCGSVGHRWCAHRAAQRAEQTQQPMTCCGCGHMIVDEQLEEMQQFELLN